MKTCSKCGQAKPLLEFSRRSDARDALSHRCRDCHGESARQWYQANRTRVIAKSTSYNEANREQVAGRMKAYRESNRERHSGYMHARRARILERPTEMVLLSVLIERDKGCCQICGKSQGGDKWSIDHILPVSRGGANTYANTQLAHLSCNKRRKNTGAAQLRMLS